MNPSQPCRCSVCRGEIRVTEVSVNALGASSAAIAATPLGSLSYCPRLGCVGTAWVPLAGR